MLSVEMNSKLFKNQIKIQLKQQIKIHLFDENISKRAVLLLYVRTIHTPSKVSSDITDTSQTMTHVKTMSSGCMFESETYFRL